MRPTIFDMRAGEVWSVQKLRARAALNLDEQEIVFEDATTAVQNVSVKETRVMDLSLRNRAAIVTGASKGIGKAVAVELVREGCRVVLTARNEEGLEETAEELHKIEGTGQALVVTADVTEAVDVEHLVRRAISHFGTVHVLVNNAGGVLHRLPFHELTDEQWLEALELNLMSAVRLTRSVLPLMRKAGWGRIINIASESAAQPGAPKPHYNASKAALINLTKSLSKTYGGEGITVNAVSPGTTMTPAVEDLIMGEVEHQDLSLEEREAIYVRENKPNILLGRVGRVQEVASVVAFLASERASFITGANYRVDGGSVATIS